ncbi:hypothetical protein [Mesorhizobium sp. M1E.F.Ca.ET.063.01.1.1]|uniref:hypothetical protein n=1 Tax=Mesorhizobium sp. M1E.F.Ca.ET.063.01.1.1 TaxID=2496750 RepID=UPI001676E15E|nr:hypothetical protein [Mesorhizobium sp. M1E.F.Ca.ET.063.01.1.1]
MAALVWPFQGKAWAAELRGERSAADPMLSLWEEWKAAALKTETLCRKQQRLETQLVQDVGFPRARLRLSDNGEKVTVFSHDAIEDIYGSDPKMATLRAEAEAELAAHQALWDAADEMIGYAAARREEEEAGDREQDLVDALPATPATSLAGIASKLDVVLHEGESWEECTEFPWPHIRSALRDLVRVGQAVEPDVFMPGSDRQAPFPRKHQEGCWVRVSKGPAASLG